MAMESRRAGPRSWVIRWGSRLKFTLRTLLVLVLFIGSAATLWLHWQPWVLERTVQVSNDTNVDVHYSPDGRQIAAVGTNAVHILDATGAERAVLQHPDRVGDIFFSPDGHHLVTTSRDHARVWNVETGVEEANLQGHSRIMSAVYSPDGRRILTTSNVDTAEVWDARNFTELAVLKGHLIALCRPRFHRMLPVS
jgi:WD40 repeat protein